MANLLYFLGLLYLIIPKIDIFALGGSAIRVGDLILAVSFFLLLFHNQFRLRVNAIFLFFSIFLLVQFISTLINFKTVGVAGFVFTLRLLEYSLWFFIGSAIANKIENEKFITHMSIITMLLFLWAVFEYQGLLPKFGKFISVQDRVSVNTSGPFEFSVVAAFLVFYNRSIFLKIISIISLFLTQSRVTFVAFIIAVLPYKIYSRRLLIVFIFIVILLTVAIEYGLIIYFLENTRFNSLLDTTGVF